MKLVTAAACSTWVNLPLSTFKISRVVVLSKLHLFRVCGINTKLCQHLLKYISIIIIEMSDFPNSRISDPTELLFTYDHMLSNFFVISFSIIFWFF